MKEYAKGNRNERMESNPYSRIELVDKRELPKAHGVDETHQIIIKCTSLRFFSPKLKK